MPYKTPDFTAIRERLLRDIRNLDADAHTSADSDNFIRSSATASAVEGLYDHQQWIARQILPDTADPEYLDLHASLRGIVRKAATAATGTLSLVGQAGAVAPAGTQCKDADGILYQTTAPVSFTAASTINAPCIALRAGALPDMADAPVTLLSAPSGIQSKGRLTLSGGSNAEDDSSLLARLLFYMRNPPGGGNAADYVRWSLEVPGVSGATVYPLRQGPGTVDIIISGEDGIPSVDVVTACQVHIDTMRPVTAKASTVYAPVPLYVDTRWKLRPQNGHSLQSLHAAVTTVLAAQFALLVPGQPVIVARLLAALAGLSGVADVALLAPVANVHVEGLHWARLGSVSLEAM